MQRLNLMLHNNVFRNMKVITNVLLFTFTIAGNDWQQIASTSLNYLIIKGHFEEDKRASDIYFNKRLWFYEYLIFA